MRKSITRSIISLALVVFMLLPNLSVVAVELNDSLQYKVEESIENETILSGDIEGNE